MQENAIQQLIQTDEEGLKCFNFTNTLRMSMQQLDRMRSQYRKSSLAYYKTKTGYFREKPRTSTNLEMYAPKAKRTRSQFNYLQPYDFQQKMLQGLRNQYNNNKQSPTHSSEHYETNKNKVNKNIQCNSIRNRSYEFHHSPKIQRNNRVNPETSILFTNNRSMLPALSSEPKIQNKDHRYQMSHEQLSVLNMDLIKQNRAVHQNFGHRIRNIHINKM